MAEFRTICKIEDVPEGSAQMFRVDDLQIGIFHVNGKFFALDNRCPHAGASLAHGIIEGETVYCRIHHWHFSLQDGSRLDETCPGFNVKNFPIRIIGQDLQVDIGGPP